MSSKSDKKFENIIVVGRLRVTVFIGDQLSAAVDIFSRSYGRAIPRISRFGTKRSVAPAHKCCRLYDFNRSQVSHRRFSPFVHNHCTELSRSMAFVLLSVGASVSSYYCIIVRDKRAHGYI